MIKVVDIWKYFDNNAIIKNVTASFEKGKTNLIIGQSGSGKTVLLKCIVGLLEPDNGNVFYDERNFTKMNIADKQIVRKELGMLFQGGALFDSLNIEENVMFPLNMFTKYTKEEKLERVNFCLKRVNLGNINHLYPSELSGGMKKRAAIARAIANNPKYLFCDEPNSGLDPKTAIIIDNLIREITKEYNITTIINTHDMNSVMEIGDNVVFMYSGEVWWKGTREDILHSSNKELNSFVYASELLKKLK